MDSKYIRELLSLEMQMEIPPHLLKNWVRRGVVPEPRKTETGRWDWSNADYFNLKNLILQKRKNDNGDSPRS